MNDFLNEWINFEIRPTGLCRGSRVPLRTVQSLEEVGGLVGPTSGSTIGALLTASHPSWAPAFVVALSGCDDFAVAWLEPESALDGLVLADLEFCGQQDAP
jgi:hypothetical protein